MANAVKALVLMGKFLITILTFPYIGVEMSYINFNDGHKVIASAFFLVSIVLSILFTMCLIVLIIGSPIMLIKVIPILKMEMDEAEFEDRLNKLFNRYIKRWIPKLIFAIDKYITLLFTVLAIWNVMVFLKLHTLNHLRLWIW